MSAKISVQSLNPRVQELIEKHLGQLSQEIAAEIIRPLFQEVAQRLTAKAPQLLSSPSPLIGLPEQNNHDAAPLIAYDFRTRLWRCTRCGIYTDIRRRAVSTHARQCKVGPVETVSKQRGKGAKP